MKQTGKNLSYFLDLILSYYGMWHLLKWTDEEQVAAMIEWTAMTYGGLDVMFSNAGIISGLPQTALDLDLSEYDRVMRVNARGMVVCVKQSARKMVEM
ncbi:(+)-cis,cis-nepetalactol synthase neps3 [Salvia divinorum]|uniref:(+)-cis,cis-nepetalactol synthase neps3 n=1 Tax=Salvia divinorum TaxID=28513 RepID=A0ABD1I4K4_SALDI